MSSTVTWNNWATFGLGACERSLKEFPDGIRVPCLSFVHLHSLVQCRPLPHLLHIPECWVFLFFPFPEEILFLGIPCLQSLLRCPIVSWRVLFVGVSVLFGSRQLASPKENHTEDSIRLETDWPINSGYLLALITYVSPLFLSMLATWLSTFLSVAAYISPLWWSGQNCRGSSLLPRILPFSLLYLYFLSGFPAYTSCLANQRFIKIHDWQNTDNSPTPVYNSPHF